MRQMYEWRHFWTPPFHRASKTTNLLVLFLYIILYPHSLHLIGSLDFISFSMWHSPQISIIGCCFGGSPSFWVSVVSVSTSLIQHFFFFLLLIFWTHGSSTVPVVRQGNSNPESDAKRLSHEFSAQYFILVCFLNMLVTFWCITYNFTKLYRWKILGLGMYCGNS